MSSVKTRLQGLLQIDRELSEEEKRRINPCIARSIEAALHIIGNPVQCCVKVHELIQKLVETIRAKCEDPKVKSNSSSFVAMIQRYRFLRCADGVLYHGESWELMARRWGKLEKDFKANDEQLEFDISKIPDIYDCIKYDLQHNQAALKYVNLFFLNFIHSDFV